MIFGNLSIEELLTVLPCVCKSWRNAITGPHCRQKIVLEEWGDFNDYDPRHLDRLLRMLIPRSGGSLRELHAGFLQNDATFSFITQNVGSLQVLRIPDSVISGSIVEQTAHRLSTITVLDLSYCEKIGARALEAVGKHCKLLVTLCRNMEPFESLEDDPLERAANLKDDEANAIAATMPGLKRLEMANLLVSSGSVIMNILSCCPRLEYLDVRDCCDTKLDEGFLVEKFPNLKIFGPFVPDDERGSDEFSFLGSLVTNPYGSDFYDPDDDSDFDPSHSDTDDHDIVCHVWPGYTTAPTIRTMVYGDI